MTRNSKQKLKVRLEYYKKSGKYYSSGSYLTDKEHMFQIFEEVRDLRTARKLPDLIEGCTQFAVRVEVPDHKFNYPALIID